MKKFCDILLSVFSVGILICIFAGFVSLIGYIVAICIGGSAAEALCEIIFETYFPYVIKTTSVIVGIGLIAMYLTKQRALTVSSEKNK